MPHASCGQPCWSLPWSPQLAFTPSSTGTVTAGERWIIQYPRRAALVAQWPHTDAALALLGDKQFLLAPDNSSFIMYSQSGGSLIALGEPIGNDQTGKELAWSFHGLADKLALRTVFYGVGPQSLPLFLDMGLVALKLGEVARVDLAEFSLEGPRRQPFRYADRKIDKDGLTFEIIPAADVPPLIPRLQEISDAWLDFNRAARKGSRSDISMKNT